MGHESHKSMDDLRAKSHPRAAATSQQDAHHDNFNIKIGKCQPPATPGPRRGKGKHGGEKPLLTILLCTMETHAEKIGSCTREPSLWPQDDDRGRRQRTPRRNWRARASLPMMRTWDHAHRGPLYTSRRKALDGKQRGSRDRDSGPYCPLPKKRKPPSLQLKIGKRTKKRYRKLKKCRT